MYKFKNKINDIWNIIKKNKRLKYLSLMSVLVLFCLALNVTFAKYTASKNNKGTDITIGDLKYNMIINEVELNESVGTKIPSNTIIGDRIILLKAGKTEQFNVTLISKNTFDTKYEITYRVCTDEKCTSFLDTPSEIDIAYQAETPYVNGTIKAEKSKSLILISDNQSSSNYYVQISLNAGYSHNELALENQITNSISSATLDGNLQIIAYVEGVEVEAFPTTDNFNVSISCKSPTNSTSNVVGTAVWSGTKWVINVVSIDSRNTTCKVYFTEKTGEEIKAPTGWYTAADGTLLAAMRNGNVIGTPATIPGKEISTANEKVLAFTPDDYGTSFYYRGAVTNNFVVFANMCWRIVRITGNGAIKLVLYNRNDSSLENPCNQTGNNLSFAKYKGNTVTTKFNPSELLNAYVGFMYGSPDSSSYAAEHENRNDSTILINLKTWYDSKLRNYNDMLADTVWCNDKNLVGYDGYSDNWGDYGAYKRLINPNLEHSASLLCDTISKTNVDKNLSRFTSSDTINGNGKLKGSNGVGELDYKIGLLTADEVAFAGAKTPEEDGSSDANNTTYYLYANAKTAYWTLSPAGRAESTLESLRDAILMSNIYVNSAGAFLEGVVSASYGLRPAIALLSSVTIASSDGTSGDGTATNPYVIKTS